MSMIYQIEALPSKGHSEPHGRHVLQEIKDSGIKDVRKVSYAPLYQIEGHLNLREIDMIARQLLIDPVTQTYALCNPSNPRRSGGGGFEIEIWYRHGVTDTVAESVVKAVKDLGIDKHVKVKTGHKYVIETSLSRGAVEQVVSRLLANPMIQEYKKIK